MSENTKILTAVGLVLVLGGVGVFMAYGSQREVGRVEVKATSGTNSFKAILKFKANGEVCWDKAKK